MNHQRGATAGEHRICAFTQGHFRVVDRQLCRTVSFDREVRHIAGMWLWTLGIVHAVMRILRIEVTARGGECRSFTLSRLVDMDRVFAWRQVLEIQRNLHTFAARSIRNLRRSDFLARSVFQSYGDRL